MWSGDDPLAYVSNARNVILEGWLMPNGLPVGRGEPFYFYPVFRYVMGLAQAVIGEDFSVIRLVNGWSVAAVLPLSWALGWRDQRWWAAIAGMTALTWFIHAHMLPYALIGYTDSLFTGVVFLSLVCCRLAITRRGLWTIAAGVSCAIAAGTRPSFLTFTPLFILAIVLWGKAVLPGRAFAWPPASRPDSRSAWPRLPSGTGSCRARPWCWSARGSSFRTSWCRQR